MSTAAPRMMTFVARQLQRKFKHAVDFGVMGPYSHAQALRFEHAMRRHVEDEATLAIMGTYRGKLVTHFVNPQTGVNVIRDAQNTFVSGWRLAPAQLIHVLTRGSL